MFISFGSFMKRFGGFRMGVRLDKSTGCFYACVFGMFQLTYWLLLLTGWMIYAVCWLCFYWPIKAIVKAVKKRKRNK